MNQFSASIQQRRLLWIDFHDYSARLLSGGRIPWLATDELINWQKRSVSLLPTDVVSVPVGRVIAAWFERHGDLATLMAAKRRPGHPLRALLSHVPLRSHLVELVSGLRRCFPDKPIALVAPAPEEWLKIAYRQVFSDEDVVFDEDLVDDAAMYIAEFLREFAGVGLDALLLDARETDRASYPFEPLDMYGPIRNLAEHYRWSLGVMRETAAIGSAVTPHFWIGRGPVDTEVAGHILGDEFWGQDELKLAGAPAFLYLEIPESANPERVLDKLKLAQ